MSMILDALSRAERERRNEQHHELDAGRYVPSSTIKEDRFKKWVSIALLLNFILIIVIVMVYLWRTDALPGVSQNKSNPESVTATTPKEVMPTQVQQKVATPQVTQVPIKPEPTQVNDSASNSSLLNEAQVNKKLDKVVKKIPVAKASPQPPPVSYSSKPLSQEKPASFSAEQLLSVQKSGSNQNYMTLTDLAPAQRSRLNQYEVNVHVYDENAQNSFVLINMTKYKEGDRLPGGQDHIDSIVPEGVVVDFGGGRVLIERN